MNHADYALVFKALSDETRLKIVLMLCNGEHCACKLLENFNITQPTLSYHMKTLCDCGLVEGRREGAWIYYSLNKDIVSSVREVFDNICSDTRCGDDCNV